MKTCDELVISESLVVATKNVAKSKSRKIKDGDTREKVKNEVETALTRKLKSIGSETKDARQKSEVKGDAVSMDILSTLKMVKEPEVSQAKNIKPPTLSDEQAAFLKERNRKRFEARNKQMAQEYEPINLFEAEKPLGIFQASQSEDTACETLKTWLAISNREMGILTTQSPRNLIEDMASMTEKGILWHFPINNEQGIDEDQVGILRYFFFRNQGDLKSLMTIFSNKTIFEQKLSNDIFWKNASSYSKNTLECTIDSNFFLLIDLFVLFAIYSFFIYQST